MLVSPDSNEVGNFYVAEFVQQVEAGVKKLLPRKGSNELKVPRYDEVRIY